MWWLIPVIMLNISNQCSMNVPMDPVLIEQTEKLIDSGCNYRLASLDTLYSPLLRIVKLEEGGRTVVLNKEENMSFFRTKLLSNSEPLSKEAVFHYAEIIGDRGYVYLTRRMALNGQKEELKYHIEWFNNGGSWQVIHENVFVSPL